MRSALRSGLVALLALMAFSTTASAQVVISQVYGGGGNTGALYRSDFIELFNRGNTNVSLAGWSVQYTSSTGSGTWTKTDLTSGIIAPGQYLLIKQADGTGTTLPALPTPDFTGTIAMSGTAGKVALVNNTTALSGACPTAAAIQDLVGFGTATNCFETAPTANLSNTTAAIRNAAGCTDTGNNSTDFTIAAPNPRNSGTPTQTCGAALPTLSISDVNITEGNSGTVNANFTVSLSAPAGAGGVTFDVATANGTATAGADYVANNLTGQSIAAGNNSFTFSVIINGDINAELDETFFVNVTNIAGATALDAQGLGTIINDDVLPALTMNDVSQLEGNTGTSLLTFTINLSAAAPAGGSVITLTYNDGTATSASGDYAAGPSSVTVPEGQTSATFAVTINGDIDLEADETFSITASLGADSATANGTITNDDIALTPIHTIQGAGNTSPLVGSTVSTTGVVTGKRTNGFFLQTPDIAIDADPLTSQGVFVFTSAAPNSVSQGDFVRVTGSVVEFISANTNQLPLTEITTPTSIVVISSGNPLPASIVLTSADANAASPLNSLERYEGMRVTVSLTVVAPAAGFENEANATSTGNGVFYGVLPGVSRPFRERGISVLDTFVPAAGIPVWDSNPERIRVQSTGLGGAQMNPNAGDTLSAVSGILDYGFGAYTFVPYSGQSFTSVAAPRAVSTATNEEFTVAGFNLFRFFDSVNDPAISDPVLTSVALNNRLAKTADAICTYLKTPDIIGVVEVENIGVLTQLANTINNGQVTGGAAVPNCSSAPNYVPYLVEGNDVGGIDVGFLVSTKIIGPGSSPRVEVLQVVQENKDEQLTNPDNSTALLNDRPSLRLQAVVRSSNGAAYPVTIFINHLRSLSGVNDAVDGPRIRNKRLKQAQSLAALINARQVANPNEKIILLGDFNAFEFNDGFVDSMGIITGNPAPASEVTLPSANLVVTPLTNMSTVDALDQRYSFSFDGSAQSLDHAVVNEPLLMQDTVRSEHARINADFAVINYGKYPGDAGYIGPVRVSDHDPVVLFIKPRSFVNIDLGVAVSNPDTSINAGASTTFQVIASHTFTQAAVNNAQVSIVIDAAINGVSVSSNGGGFGWSCAAPVVNATNTTINCTAAVLTSGSTQFDVVVPTPATFVGGDLTLSAAISAEQGDNQIANNIASDSVNVNGQITDLAIAMSGPAQITVGKKTMLTATASNSGSRPAVGVSVALTANVPANTMAINTPAGWTCAEHGNFVNTRFLCALNNDAPFNAAEQARFELRFNPSRKMANYSLVIGAGISAITADSSAANNSDSYSSRIELIQKIPTPMPRD
jgi:uncharacterized protein